MLDIIPRALASFFLAGAGLMDQQNPGLSMRLDWRPALHALHRRARIRTGLQPGLPSAFM